MQYDKLKSSTSFAQLRRSGSSYVAPTFVILATKDNTSDKPLKVGFTASKKVGNAIKRALARRRLRAALQQIPNETIEEFKGYEFNIVARHKSMTTELPKIVFYFKKTLQNIKLDEKN